MMSKNAIVFGATVLCANSIKHLSQRGWNILGIVSDDSDIVELAKEYQIELYANINQILRVEEEFYLFSIINAEIIPKQVLGFCRKLATVRIYSIML